jgi:putative zinc finger/helix-turn-helix YgiT family protein
LSEKSPLFPPRGRTALALEEIRQGREKLALTQKQFANLLGVGEATVSRWETGAQIQQRAMDRFLRVCRASPAAWNCCGAISRRARCRLSLR